MHVAAAWRTPHPCLVLRVDQVDADRPEFITKPDRVDDKRLVRNRGTVLLGFRGTAVNGLLPPIDVLVVPGGPGT